MAVQCNGDRVTRQPGCEESRRARSRRAPSHPESDAKSEKTCNQHKRNKKDENADQDTMRPDIGYGAARGPPGVALPPAADQACQRSCAALSHCPRSELPVARGGIRARVMDLCCALHAFRVRLTPWQPMRESGYTPMSGGWSFAALSCNLRYRCCHAASLACGDGRGRPLWLATPCLRALALLRA
jgi:hypothetical protein